MEKKIIITEEIFEDVTSITFKSEGFSKFEIVGILEYYKDHYKNNVIKLKEIPNEQ